MPGQHSQPTFTSLEDLKCWGAWDTSCGHKAKGVTPSIAWRMEGWKQAPSIARRSYLKIKRMGHRQSDEHWNCFKGNRGETPETRGGAAYGLFRAPKFHLEMNSTEPTDSAVFSVDSVNSRIESRFTFNWLFWLSCLFFVCVDRNVSRTQSTFTFNRQFLTFLPLLLTVLCLELKSSFWLVLWWFEFWTDVKEFRIHVWFFLSWPYAVNGTFKSNS